MAGSSSTASIGVQVEGVPQATRDLSPLVEMLERLGTAGGAHSTSTPSNAPASAPKLSNPIVDYYASPTQSGIGWTQPAGWQPGGGVLMSGGYGGYNTGRPGSPLSPGILAPPPAASQSTAGGGNGGGGGYNGGPNWTPPFPGGGGGGSYGPGFGGGSPLNVNILGSIPLSVHIVGGGGSGSGGSGGGTGTGTGSGSGAGSGGSGGGANAGSGHPLPGWSPQQSTSTPGQQFLQALMKNPSIGGAVKALWDTVPAVPTAIIEGAAGVAAYGLNAYRAATDPRFQTDLNIGSQQASGQYINPLMASAMRRTADFQGQDNLNRALMAPFDKVLFGLPSDIYDLTTGRDYQQKVAMSQAAGQDDLIRQQISAITRQPLATNGTVQALQTRLDAAKARLGSQSAGGNDPGVSAWLNNNNPDTQRTTDLIASLTKQIAAAKGAVGDRQYDTQVAQLASAASVYGLGFNSDYGQSFIKKYTASGQFSADMVTKSGEDAYGYAMRPGNADLAQSIVASGGKLPDGVLAAEIKRAIGSGDLSTILGMNSLIQDAGKFQAAMKAAMPQFILASSTIPLAASRVDMTQANLQYDAATGASYQTVGSEYGSQATALRAQLAVEQQYLKGITNPLDRQRQAVKIRGLQAQMQGALGSQISTTLTGKSDMNLAFAQYATNRFTRANFGGSEADVLSAYGLQITAAQRDYGVDLGWAGDSHLTPQQRAQYRQRAEADKIRYGIQLPREISAYRYGITQSRIAVGGATADAASTTAGLFGGPQDAYAASMGQANVIQSQIGALRQRLSDPTAGLTVQERLDGEKSLIDSTRQLTQMFETAKRNLQDATIEVAQFTRGIASSQASNAMQFMGVGGVGASSLLAGVAQKSSLSLDQAYQKYLDTRSLPVGNARRMEAEQGLVAAQGTHLSDTFGIMNAAPNLDAQLQRQQASWSLQLSDHLFTPWMNTRGALQADAAATGSMMKDSTTAYHKTLSQIDADWNNGHSKVFATRAEYEGARKQALFNYNGQEQQYGSQILSDLDRATNGWQDRLTASVINTPTSGRARYVSSMFSQAEAAPYLNALGPLYNGRYGWSGAGGAATRDAHMALYPDLMNTLVGTNSRQGFAATAMAEAQSGMAAMPGGVLRPGGSLGTVEIKLTVDSKGAVSGAATTLGRGGSNAVTGSLKNGAITLSLPLHAATSSHQ